MKGTACNIDALVVNELEGLAGANRMRKGARVICGSSFLCAHRHDLVGNELLVVVQTHAEEVGARLCLHVARAGVQLRRAHARRMILVVGDRDVVVNTMVALLGERRRHNVAGIALGNFGRRRIQVARQVAGLRATNRVLVVEDGSRNLVLDQVGAQRVCARHNLRGDLLPLNARVVIRLGGIEGAAPVGLRVLIEDDRVRCRRRIAGSVDGVERVVGLSVTHHLDEQLVVRGKTRGHVVALFVLKDRLNLEVRNGREPDGANALRVGRGDGVLVGNRTVAKALAAVVVAVDDLLIVLGLAVYVDKLGRNRIARLIEADLRIAAVVVIGRLAANLDLTKMAVIGAVVRVDLAVSCCRNCHAAINRDGGDVVERATVRLPQGREQVPVALVGSIERDGVAVRLFNVVLIRIRLAEGISGLSVTRGDSHQEAIEDIAVLDIGATVDDSSYVSILLNLKILAQNNGGVAPRRVGHRIGVVIRPAKRIECQRLRRNPVKGDVLLVVIGDTLSVLVVSHHTNVHRVAATDVGGRAIGELDLDFVGRLLYGTVAVRAAALSRAFERIGSKVGRLGHCAGAVMPPIIVGILLAQLTGTGIFNQLELKIAIDIPKRQVGSTILRLNLSYG